MKKCLHQSMIEMQMDVILMYDHVAAEYDCLTSLITRIITCRLPR